MIPDKKRQARETQFQIALVEMIGWRKVPGLIFAHVPNGGLRSKAEAGRLKAMGVRRGFYDLLFFIPVKGAPAFPFLLELKVQDEGVLSADQIQFGEDCAAIGVAAEVAYNMDQALAILVGVGAIKPEARRR